MRWLASIVLVLVVGLAPATRGYVQPVHESQPPTEEPRHDLHDLTIIVRDAVTDEQVPSRCSVVDVNGEPAYPIPAAGCFYHQPYGDAPAYYYTGGRSTLFVPAGAVEVTISRGFEFETVVDTVGVRNDTTVTFHIGRWIDLNGMGLYSGDCHTHADHSGGIYDVQPDDAHFMAQAEGLNVINCLDMTYHFTGGPDTCSTPDCIVYMGEEYRSSTYGHSDLLGLSSLILPPSTSWWPLVMDIADSVHAQPGAAMICAHPITTSDFYDIETIQGMSLARELPVDVTKYKVDGYELLSGYSNSHRRTMEMWYRVLNCGFRLPACAGTDAGLSASYGKPPGSYRVYVQIDGQFTYDSWLQNMIAGRTFVTNGPLFTHFDVRDFALGDSVNLGTDGMTYLDGSVRVECETPLARVDIICNGERVQTFFAEEGQCVIDESFLVMVDESSWIAARASGPKVAAATVGDSLFAHSGPVYFCLDGERIVEEESAQELAAWVGDLERLAIMRGEWTGPGQPLRLFRELESARVFYASLAAGATTGVDDTQPATGEAWLTPGRPNPFSESTSLSYSTPEEGRVRVRVYSPSGRLVRTLIDRRLPAGGHYVRWDGNSSAGRPCGSGVYLCRLETGTSTISQKIVLMR